MTSADAPGQAWSAVVRRTSEEAFAKAFTEGVVLEASVASDPIIGAAKIYRFFQATRALYTALAFTHETVGDNRRYLEWSGTYRGQPVDGVTVLVFDVDGVIEKILLHHRPYHLVVAMSADIARLLDAGRPQPRTP